MRVAVAQPASTDDVAANLAEIARLSEEAAGLGAEVVLFPEYATYEKKRLDETFARAAQPLDGPVCAELASTARRHGITLVAGVVEASPAPDRPYNTLAAFSPDGTLAAAYRKIHLFDAQGQRESDFISPAPSAEPVTFDAGGVTFGLMTCYDLRFPELAAALAEAGAQVLALGASWVPGELKTQQWRTLSAARAIDNAVFVAGSCQAPPISIGSSLIIDPQGDVLALLGPDPGVVVADLDLARIASTRLEFPVVEQRRIPSSRP
ncbi:carbon-nitrogen hydrolase family protein [Sinomonas humi]|uniref:Amidohydrolase n=1 Tax=Sinomonas humi TaxID=1338436 RepID=A0A0B2AQW2_9MICC|nr:carbon-nitrogen hydrolase family protein [Sinomonas humi]KHL04327.1 amidohydrolase [Sinomonas humi]